jgi:predicted Zn finger-like uncharacterized protein
MKLAEGIRKHGFRKWYERELLQSHAHMLLLLFCTLGLLMAFEGSSRSHPLSEQLTDLATVLMCTATGLWALRRYLYLLSHAESVANQADCPQCGTYGRMDLLQSDAAGDEVQVRCRKCGHAWHISS